MKRYTIVVRGVIMGTYEGADENAALATLQQEQPGTRMRLADGDVKMTELVED